METESLCLISVEMSSLEEPRAKQKKWKQTHQQFPPYLAKYFWKTIENIILSILDYQTPTFIL